MGRRFDWVRRMGAHEAHHTSTANRVIHWLCIPVELFMLAELLSHVALGPIDLALVVIVATSVVYLMTDVVAGALMLACLLGLWRLALVATTGSVAVDCVGAVVAFVAAFVVQTRVGHGVFERGIDDTEDNLRELARTKNPVPILLVFYYHLVEVLFAAGYRPALRREMEAHREATLRALRTRHAA